jgi:hypothetical protein
MRRFYPLKSLTYTSGGRALVELDQLPSEHYLKGFLFSMGYTATMPGAHTAVTSPAQNQLVNSLKCGRRWALTGQAINAMNWLITGKDNSAAAAIALNSNGVSRRVLNLFIPLIDSDGYEADDCAAAVELFRDTPLELVFGAASSIFPSITTFTPDTFFTQAVIQKGSPGKVATPVQYDVIDLNADTRLDPGNYTHLAIFKEDGTYITDTDVTALTVIIDGVPVIDNQSVGTLAAMFNALKALGGEAGGFTAGATAIPGEAVDEQPGAAVGAAAGLAMPIIPVLYPQKSGKLTAAWPCPTGIRIKYSGAGTGLRAVTRRIEAVSDAQVLKAAEKMGAMTPTVIQPKTASKADTSPIKAALLPKRFNFNRK